MLIYNRNHSPPSLDFYLAKVLSKSIGTCGIKGTAREIKFLQIYVYGSQKIKPV